MNKERSNHGTMSNTWVLCFILGWQGGTVHQVAHELQVSTTDIIEADEDMMGDLGRKAQEIRYRKSIGEINAVMFKNFKTCVEALKADYDGHDIPPWLERAAGVLKITSEYFTEFPDRDGLKA